MPESLKQFIVGFLKYWYVSLIPAYIFTPISIYELVKKDAWNSIHMPVWLLLSFFIITLIAACYLTYRDLWNQLPEDRKGEYLQFSTAAKYVLRNYVDPSLLVLFDNTPFHHWNWVALHLEQAAAQGGLNLYRGLDGGPLITITYDNARLLPGPRDELYAKPALFLKRSDLKGVWGSYCERNEIMATISQQTENESCTE